VQSWQHNTTQLSHSGIYCADKSDARSACLWDTDLLVVRNGSHFPPGRPQIGVFNGGTWWLDRNNDGYWEGASDRKIYNFGQPGDIPVIRKAYDGTRSMITVTNPQTSQWWMDVNLNYAWDGDDQYVWSLGWQGALPFAGRGSSGISEWLYENIGVYDSSNWYWDTNNNQVLDDSFLCPVCDAFMSNFGQPGDKPVMGAWTTNIRGAMGVFKDGAWWLDWNGNNQWDGGDRFYRFGIAGDQPVVGDWNGTGYDKVGVFRNGRFYLDWNGNGRWDYGDVIYFFGKTGDTPVVGVW